MTARKSPAKLVTMPAELWARIDAAAGERGRSAFLALAAERELQHLEKLREVPDKIKEHRARGEALAAQAADPAALDRVRYADFDAAAVLGRRLMPWPPNAWRDGVERGTHLEKLEAIERRNAEQAASPEIAAPHLKHAASLREQARRAYENGGVVVRDHGTGPLEVSLLGNMPPHVSANRPGR